MLGVASCTREALEGVPAAELVAATEEMGKRSPDPGMIPLPFLPVVDGVLLPAHPLEAVADGAAAGIDLLIGTNRDELTLFGLGNPALMALDADGVTRWVENAVPDMSALAGGGRLPLGPRVAGRVDRARPRSGSPSEPMSSSVGPASSWRPRRPHVARVPTSISSIGSRRRSAGSWARAMRWSCRSCSGRSAFPWCRSSRGAARPSRRSPPRCRRHGCRSPRPATPSHEGIGAWRPWEPADRATMIFGAHTRLVSAPGDEELAVLEQARPLIAGRARTREARTRRGTRDEARPCAETRG